MKVLVVQLARFGDILQTTPIVNALKRTGCQEVDLLVRERYSDSSKFSKADNVIGMDTAEFMSPIFQNEGFQEKDFWSSLEKLETFCEGLKSEQYDLIVNLSFSPFSSYLTYFITTEETQVKGYSRFADGFLNIVDDASAYFYAQVGINGQNRFHLIDLFASIAGVELIEEDYWLQGDFDTNIETPYVVLHLGASSPKKALPAVKWNQLLRKLVANGEKPILIGTKNEEDIARETISGISQDKFTNLVGKTSFQDLFNIIKHAKYYIGADSGPLHICNFFDTTCFNLSNKEVNFFETGPKSNKSYIWYEDNFSTFDTNHFIAELNKALAGEETGFIKSSKFEPYIGKDHFNWQLIQAIYTEGEFPVTSEPKILQALIQLNEVNEISLHQLNKFKEGDQTQVNVLSTADQIMSELSRECSDILPLIQWFLTEKTRVGPGATNQILQRYKELHFKLSRILNLYVGSSWKKTEVQDEQSHL